MNTLIQYAVMALAILVTVTIHEFTKAVTSTILGDNAPQNDKRLTINPFKHFEPVGFLFMLLFGGYGWGKPVRTSSVYYKNRTKGTVITYTAPIIANLIFGFIFALANTLIIKFAYPLLFKSELTLDIFKYVVLFFNFLVTLNVSLAIFNIIPVSPLSGNRIMTALMSPNEALKMTHYEKLFQIILVMVMCFGLVGTILDPVVQTIIDFYNFILKLIFV